MGELAQLPWWQLLKWRRRRLQQLPARGFGGGAGRLGCTVPSPARGPVCWGGACKNPRGARDGLTEGAGGRGQRARSKGLPLVLGCGRWSGRAQRDSEEVIARFSPSSPSRGFAPSLFFPGFLGRPPRGGPHQGWEHVELEPALLLYSPSFLNCSSPWCPRMTPKETRSRSGCPSGQAAGPFLGLVPSGHPSLLGPL